MTEITVPKQTPANLYASRVARLYPLLSANAWTHWFYDSLDPISQVGMSAYFGPVRADVRLRKGDFISVVERYPADRPARGALFIVEDFSDGTYRLSQFLHSPRSAE
jgi:hypothetical protein